MLYLHIITTTKKAVKLTDAFDTVPHDGLLSKLKHNGIDEKIWLWIYNFLKKQETLTSLDKLIISVLEEETLNLSIEPLLFKVFLFGTKVFRILILMYILHDLNIY